MEMKVIGEEKVRNLGKWPFKCSKYLKYLTAVGVEGETKAGSIQKHINGWGAVLDREAVLDKRPAR